MNTHTPKREEKMMKGIEGRRRMRQKGRRKRGEEMGMGERRGE